MSSIDEDKTLLVSDVGRLQKVDSQNAENILKTELPAQSVISPDLVSNNQPELGIGVHAEEFTAIESMEVNQTEAIVLASDIQNRVVSFENEATQLESNFSSNTSLTSAVKVSIADDKTELSQVSTPPNQPSAMADTQYQTIENQGSELQSVQLAIGDVLNKRFELVESLGKGGMGMVFKALDLRRVETKARNPYVAIKVLSPELASNHLLVAALQRECEKTQALAHPNIISVYDFDKDGEYVFMSMEFLSGQILSDIIKESALAGGVKLARAWPMIRKMGEALAYAHKKNIVHRDFKPANVFVTEEGDIKVLDFGISTKIETSEAEAVDMSGEIDTPTRLVSTGLTPTYASLEMIRGELPDARDDIYSFGLVVYELLTGQHPYARRSADQVFYDQQIKTGKNSLQPVKKLSRRQWLALKSALELIQAKRPRNLDEWLKEFDPAAKWSLTILGVIGLSSFLIIGFGVNWWMSKNPPVTETVQAPVTFKIPLAKPCCEQQAQVGGEVSLDGTASQSGDGDAISYSWRLAQLPEGSKAILQNANSATPKFLPDKPGLYQAELFVWDKHNSSLPANVAITVTGVAAIQPPVDLTTVEGVVFLSVGKPSYKVGDELKLLIHMTKTGYLRVAYLSSSGEISEILPNPYQTGRVKADTDYQVPPKSGKFKLEVGGPVGVDRIVAVFSESPLPTVENVIDANGVVVAELQNQNIVSKMIQYNVVR